MDFDVIEAQRVAAGISVKSLAKCAGVATSTYYRLLASRRGGYASTLRRLDAALRVLLDKERDERERKQFTTQSSEPPDQSDLLTGDLLWGGDVQLQQV